MTDKLYSLYSLLSDKYPDYIFGYRTGPPHSQMFYSLAVVNRLNGKAKRLDGVEVGLSDQAYVNIWLDLIRQLNDN